MKLISLKRLICRLNGFFIKNAIKQTVNECIYSWKAAYTIEEKNCILQITLIINLIPDAGIKRSELSARKKVWEQAIQEAWSEQFILPLNSGKCSCRAHSVQLNAIFSSKNSHHTVFVHAGAGRSNIRHWYMEDTGAVAAHEVGHMLGYADEYQDASCPNRNYPKDNSIMRKIGGEVQKRHYERFRKWLDSKTCCDHGIEEPV